MPDYDFGTLSPADFERMACDLLNADLGLHLHSYPEGRDQGIDRKSRQADFPRVLDDPTSGVARALAAGSGLYVAALERQKTPDAAGAG